MASKKQIAIELAKGKSNKDVAMTFGVSPSYISQLLAEDAFQALVEGLKSVEGVLVDDEESEEEKARRKERKELHEAIDDAYDLIESKSLEKLAERAAMGLITKNSELIALAKLANNAQRKTNGIDNVNVNDGIQVVQVSLPQVFINTLNMVETKVNEKNQVIAVGDQTIVNKSKESILGELNNIQRTYNERLIEGHMKGFNKLSADDL